MDWFSFNNYFYCYNPPFINLSQFQNQYNSLVKSVEKNQLAVDKLLREFDYLFERLYTNNYSLNEYLRKISTIQDYVSDPFMVSRYIYKLINIIVAVVKYESFH